MRVAGGDGGGAGDNQAGEATFSMMSGQPRPPPIGCWFVTFCRESQSSLAITEPMGNVTTFKMSHFWLKAVESRENLGTEDLINYKKASDMAGVMVCSSQDECNATGCGTAGGVARAQPSADWPPPWEPNAGSCASTHRSSNPCHVFASHFLIVSITFTYKV